MPIRIRLLLCGLSVLVLTCTTARPVNSQETAAFLPNDAIAGLERLEQSMAEFSQDDQMLRLSIQTYSDQGDVCAAVPDIRFDD